MLYRILTRCLAFKQSNKISVTFILHDGSRLTASGRENDSLLDVVRDNDLDIDGFGSCDGELACSSCHLILQKHDFDQLPNVASEEELDLLDMAGPELCDTSRLGCQVRLCAKTMENGLEVRVPGDIADARLTS
ncbi:Adrenodoxin, mitochondrial [Tyrophagus putrescentiae]|nr:Adrenodoxin, mitochondrial [Tyrophagus putrescentiae]